MAERHVRGIVTGPQNPDKRHQAKRLRTNSTPGEHILWARLRKNQLAGLHFRRQQVIDGFIADFYCHAAALVVEVDGGIHDLKAGVDANRDEVLASRGILTLRFSEVRVVKETESVLEEILRIAECRNT